MCACGTQRQTSQTARTAACNEVKATVCPFAREQSILRLVIEQLLAHGAVRAAEDGLRVDVDLADA